MCKVYKSTVQIVQKREKMTWKSFDMGLQCMNLVRNARMMIKVVVVQNIIVCFLISLYV